MKFNPLGKGRVSTEGRAAADAAAAGGRAAISLLKRGVGHVVGAVDDIMSELYVEPPTSLSPAVCAAAVRVQAVARGRAARRAVRAWRRAEAQVLSELIDSEQSYLDDLRRLSETFQQPLGDAPPEVHSEETHALLFKDTWQLMHLHRTLYEQMLRLAEHIGVRVTTGAPPPSLPPSPPSSPSSSPPSSPARGDPALSSDGASSSTQGARGGGVG